MGTVVLKKFHILKGFSVEKMLHLSNNRNFSKDTNKDNEVKPTGTGTGSQSGTGSPPATGPGTGPATGPAPGPGTGPAPGAGGEEPQALKKGVQSSKQQSIQEESYFNKMEAEQLKELKEKTQNKPEEKKK